MSTEHLALSPQELNLFNLKFTEVAMEYNDETADEFQLSDTLSGIKRSLAGKAPGLRMETVNSKESSCEIDPVTTGVCKWMTFLDTGCVVITPGECLDITIAMEILRHRFPEEMMDTYNRIHLFLANALRFRRSSGSGCLKSAKRLNSQEFPLATKRISAFSEFPYFGNDSSV